MSLFIQQMCVSISFLFHLKWTKNSCATLWKFCWIPIFHFHCSLTHVSLTQIHREANEQKTPPTLSVSISSQSLYNRCFSGFIRICWPGSKPNQNHFLPFPVFSFSLSLSVCVSAEKILRGVEWPLSLVKIKTAALHEHHTPKSVLTYALHDTEAWAFQVQCFSIEAHNFIFKRMPDV